MSYSYDEILERMENKYHELSGYNADECGDTGIRLKVLAGEIFSMGTQIDWLKRQMFFTTATGEQLDMHAKARGLSRHKGHKASGILVIKTESPVQYELIIPQGTLFTNENGSLRYISTEEAHILQGESLVTISAEAEKSGTIYNVPRRSVNCVLTYISAGIIVENASSFTGGTDDEDDEMLRRRIEESYRNIPNGANAQYYRMIAQSVDGVQSANIQEQANAVKVFIAGRGEVCTSNKVIEVQEIINQKRCAGMTVQVLTASAVTVNVSVNITVKSGYNTTAVKSAVEESIREYFFSLSVGQSVLAAEVGRAVINTDGVKNYLFNDFSDVSITASGLAVVETVTVGDM